MPADPPVEEIVMIEGPPVFSADDPSVGKRPVRAFLAPTAAGPFSTSPPPNPEDGEEAAFLEDAIEGDDDQQISPTLHPHRGKRVGFFDLFQAEGGAAGGYPMTAQRQLNCVVFTTIGLSLIYVILVIVFANVFGADYADRSESAAFGFLFNSTSTLAAPYAYEDPNIISAANAAGSVYINCLERTISTFSVGAHSKIALSTAAYLSNASSAFQVFKALPAALWSEVQREGTLLPAFLSDYASALTLASTTLVLLTDASAPAINFSKPVLQIGLSTSLCAARSPVSSCLAVSVAWNATQYLYDDSTGRLAASAAGPADAFGNELRIIAAALRRYTPATDGAAAFVVEDKYFVFMSLLPNKGGVVASLASAAAVASMVVTGASMPCGMCTPLQSDLLQTLHALRLANQLLQVVDPANSSSVLFISAPQTYSLGGAIAGIDGAVEFQSFAALRPARTFSDGGVDVLLKASAAPLRVVYSARQLTLTYMARNVSSSGVSLVRRNFSNIGNVQILHAQLMTDVLSSRNNMMDSVKSSGAELRRTVLGVTVVLGILFLAVCVFLAVKVHAATSALGGSMTEILDNLVHARTMELERATVFISRHAAGDTSGDGTNNGAPTGAKTAPFSDFFELRSLQESMNSMFQSIREVRKFLPSTLFVRGEVPLQDELAEELLLPAAAESTLVQEISPLRGASSALSKHPSAMSLLSRPASMRDITSHPNLVLAVGHDGPSCPGSRIVSPTNAPLSPMFTSPRRQLHASENLQSPTLTDLPGAGNSMFSPKQIALGAAEANLEFCLKRRKATILTVTFVGFLRMSQENVADAHAASQTFLQIVLSVIDRNGGIVLSLAPDTVVATWNAFRSDPNHEGKGAMCAHELSRTLHAADEEFLFSEHQLAICVTSGPVVAGNTGTVKERASVVHGDCVDLANELLSLFIHINLRCGVTKLIADHVTAPLWTLPFDIVTDDAGSTHELFELRSSEEPPHASVIRRGFHAFATRDYIAAKDFFADAVKKSVPRVDPTAMRLLKLSAMFAQLQTPYVRAVPSWQRFETDADTQNFASPNRKYKSEKRKSQMADEQLRMELMNLRNGGPRRSVLEASLPPVDLPATIRPSGHGVDVPGNTAQGSSPSGSPNRRRTMPGVSPLDEALVVKKRPSLTPNVVGMGLPAPRSPPPAPGLHIPNSSNSANVVEFRDKKDMVFRMSAHVLGRGAQGEVLMGMSESGGLVAIKSVALPSFIKKAGPEDSGLSDIQKRRLKRKGVNVNQNIEADLDAMLNEVAMLSHLRHESIVGYLSSAIVQGKLLVVMEYISGGSLQNLITEFTAVPVTTAKRYLRDTLKGLQYLHSQDIVHRDIKPQNVLIVIDGSCKLTDFGTSQRISKLSSSTAMEGTPQYMSPEASKGRAEKASDIWSFGILMAQLLTGQLPWPDDGCFIPMRFVYRIGNDESMVPIIAESIPHDAQEIIRWCCLRDPTKRPTATELLAHTFFTVSMPTPVSGSRSVRQSKHSIHRGSVDSQRTSTRSNDPPVAVNLMKYSAFADAASPVTTPKDNGLNGSMSDMVLPQLLVEEPN